MRISKKKNVNENFIVMNFGEAKGLSFDEIKGVGDYAVWNNKHKELKVFYKGLEFQITAELSDDEKINKQKSIETAKQIINQKLK